jgi:calcium binding protein 39
VQKFLVMNKQKLLKFLPNFLPDRTDDDQFNDEKAWLVKAIGSLPDSTSGIQSPGSSQSSGSSQVQQQSGTAQVRS